MPSIDFSQPSDNHGARLLLRIAASGEFVNRKVETVQFVGADVAERRVSVDFNLPLAQPPAWRTSERVELVLLTFLEKRSLSSFSVRDEDGRAIPSLTTEQNGWLAWSMLAFYGRALLEEPLLPDVIASVETIVRAPTKEATQALGSFLDGPDEASRDQRRRLAEETYWWVLAGDLSHQFVLVTPTPWVAGHRRIIKFAYTEELAPATADEDPLTVADDLWRAVRRWPWPRWSRAAWQKVAGRQTVRTSLRRVRQAILWADLLWLRTRQWLGWSDRRFQFPLYRVGDAHSYHFELRMPEGLAASSARIVAATDDAFESQAQEGLTDLVHLNVSPPAATAEGYVTISYRPEARGFIRSATLTATATACFLLVVLSMSEMVSDKNVDAMAALLVAAPGLATTILVRPGEHSLVSQMLVGPRMVLTTSGVAAYGAALCVALVYGWALALALAVAFVVAGFAAGVLSETLRRGRRELAVTPP